MCLSSTVRVFFLSASLCYLYFCSLSDSFCDLSLLHLFAFLCDLSLLHLPAFLCDLSYYYYSLFTAQLLCTIGLDFYNFFFLSIIAKKITQSRTLFISRTKVLLEAGHYISGGIRGLASPGRAHPPCVRCTACGPYFQMGLQSWVAWVACWSHPPPSHAIRWHRC